MLFRSLPLSNIIFVYVRDLNYLDFLSGVIKLTRITRTVHCIFEVKWCLC